MQFQNHEEEFFLEKLTAAIGRVKLSFEKKVKEVQDQKDMLRQRLDDSSSVRLLKEEGFFEQQIEQLKERLHQIGQLERFEIDDISNDCPKFETHKFTINLGSDFSEESELYGYIFSISVTDDLIGLFKSFNILMKPSQFGSMEFEYRVFLVKSEIYSCQNF
jgi:hypothetical protein